MKLRVGIVNVGPGWETQYLPALRAMTDRIEVRTVCDPVQHRAQAVASQLGVTACDSFQMVARRCDVDAIMLLSGHWYGVLPVYAACDAGKAVYCATAFNIEEREAFQLRDRVAKAGIAFLAEFPYRMSAATLRLKELIATRLGQPHLLFCNKQRISNLPGTLHSSSANQGLSNRDPGNWETYDLLQRIDWCCYVMDSDPTSLLAVRHLRKIPESFDKQESRTPQNVRRSSDFFTLYLDFSTSSEGGSEKGTGSLAQIGNSDYIQPAWRDAASYRRPAELEVVCERGVAFVDLPSTLTWFDEAGQHLEKLDHERPVGEQMLIHFHRAVESLVLKTASLDDAHRALYIASKARKSFETGQRIPC